MHRAIAVRPAGTWPDDAAVGSVTLAWGDRHRRRIRLTDDAGTPFLLDLDRTAVLADGDGLELDDGGIVRVRAASETVVDVPCGNPAEAARVAWHLGNRHAPVQVLEDGTIRFFEDAVLIDMCTRLGMAPVRRSAPFQPEPGAYALGGHGH